ncbi:chlorophyllase [Raphidocelis subcapitata]|uniref:Chlorophyllase n=1 Tax=Raphidocelis subcapitata TaxID=307507 RepID=A0A2V0NU57_9CHLO|nr:chlorophyllase [Raphidocelis subcapitata]|eukprot:GBF91171.1 chlorophyllase [Raphidocelis subcapitata]
MAPARRAARPIRSLALATLLFLARGAAGAAPADFAGPGPCAVDAAAPPIPVHLPPETGCSHDCDLELIITAPAVTQPSAGAAGDPACDAAAAGRGHPLLFFYSGFQLRASFYSGYPQRLASWGWAVVTYDLTLLDLVPAGVQSTWAPHILDALSAANADPSSPWHGRLDASRLAAAGHSRGGKIAALHLANGRRGGAGPGFGAAYLIDPVDSEGGPGEPSAVEALRGLNASVGISAAGVSGPCNPADRVEGFWEVAGPGSWRERLLHGGHVQFCNITSGMVKRALDLICGKGGDTHEAVMELTLPPMVAWLENAIGRAHLTQRPPAGGQRREHQQAQAAGGGGVAQWRRRLLQAGGGGRAPERAAGSPFWDWVDREESQGEIGFDVKS